MELTIDDWLAKLDASVCVKKKKAPHYRIAVNDWIVQTIIEDQWGTGYHTKPPQGTPDVLHTSVYAATLASIQQAFERWEVEQERKRKEIEEQEKLKNGKV